MAAFTRWSGQLFAGVGGRFSGGLTGSHRRKLSSDQARKNERRPKQDPRFLLRVRWAMAPVGTLGQRGRRGTGRVKANRAPASFFSTAILNLYFSFFFFSLPDLRLVGAASLYLYRILHHHHPSPLLLPSIHHVVARLCSIGPGKLAGVVFLLLPRRLSALLARGESRGNWTKNWQAYAVSGGTRS